MWVVKTYKKGRPVIQLFNIRPKFNHILGWVSIAGYMDLDCGNEYDWKDLPEDEPIEVQLVRAKNESSTGVKGALVKIGNTIHKTIVKK